VVKTPNRSDCNSLIGCGLRVVLDLLSDNTYAQIGVSLLEKFPLPNNFFKAKLHETLSPPNSDYRLLTAEYYGFACHRN
jgi:hypothetical protein